MSVKRGVVRQFLAIRRSLLVAGLATTLMSGALSTVVAPAGAVAPPPPRPPARDVILTPLQVADQLKAAALLRADLMRSGTKVASANTRLEKLSTQANTLLENLSKARTAQAAAASGATAQRARLVQLNTEVQAGLDSLGRLASDSYIRGGGSLGDMAAILEAITAPSADQSTDSLATVQYLMDGRTRVIDRLRSVRAAQVVTSSRAAAASRRAVTAAGLAAKAKSALDIVIVDQRKALEGLRVAQADQTARADRIRGTLLRSREASARAAARQKAAAARALALQKQAATRAAARQKAADARQLAQALAGPDVSLWMSERSTCDKDSSGYPNGRLPANVLCRLYAAPDESLTHDSASAFNAMSAAYQKETGSALCVTDGYRPYAEQVAVRRQSPGMTATPGKSQHGLGLAVDLCGGVESFAAPAHLWMKRNAPLYGWFHPGWAEPSGSMPEPWHWEFSH